MKTASEKLYNYEQMPPADLWDKIHQQVAGGKTLPMNTGRKRVRMIAFSTAAAAVITILVISFVFTKSSVDKQGDSTEIAKASVTPSDSVKENYQLLESIIKAPESKKLVAIHNAEENSNLKYFTIEGPGGEPVKISPKVASLIVSADGEFPPKPVWDAKINKWQHIMLTSSASPTSSNLLDIIQKAAGVTE